MGFRSNESSDTGNFDVCALVTLTWYSFFCLWYYLINPIHTLLIFEVRNPGMGHFMPPPTYLTREWFMLPSYPLVFRKYYLYQTDFHQKQFADVINFLLTSAFLNRPFWVLKQPYLLSGLRLNFVLGSLEANATSFPTVQYMILAHKFNFSKFEKFGHVTMTS